MRIAVTSHCDDPIRVHATRPNQNNHSASFDMGAMLDGGYHCLSSDRRTDTRCHSRTFQHAGAHSPLPAGRSVCLPQRLLAGSTLLGIILVCSRSRSGVPGHSERYSKPVPISCFTASTLKPIPESRFPYATRCCRPCHYIHRPEVGSSVACVSSDFS